MNSLEHWIECLVGIHPEEIGSKYSEEDLVMGELDSLSLPKTGGYTVHSSVVSERVLEALHHKIRNLSCENVIWDAVLWYLAHPLPMPIAHDLIDRCISTIMMGMRRQVDEVQWRLATFSEDALYTLVRERYVEPHYSVAQFENMLKTYCRTIYGGGILYMLSFYPTPSPEKTAILIAVIVQEKRNWRKFKHTKERLEQFLYEHSQ